MTTAAAERAQETQPQDARVRDAISRASAVISAATHMLENLPAERVGYEVLYQHANGESERLVALHKELTSITHEDALVDATVYALAIRCMAVEAMKAVLAGDEHVRYELHSAIITLDGKLLGLTWDLEKEAL